MTTLIDQQHPNAVAEQLTKRSYISYSALSTYASCPLRYYFKYVEGLPEDTVSSSLVFGGALHQSVEFHFNELMAGNLAPDQDALLTVFWDSWRDRNEEAVIHFGKGEDVTTIAQLAERVLAAFRQSDLAQPHGRILGVEEQLRGEIVLDIPDLLARIDLIVETDEVLVITDFKTARSRWNNGQAESNAEQLLLYSELAKQLAPGKDLRLEFSVVSKAKSPVAERHTVSVDPQRIERTKGVVQRVWRAIEAGHFYPAPSPMNCPSCPFRAPCRHWKG